MTKNFRCFRDKYTLLQTEFYGEIEKFYVFYGKFIQKVLVFTKNTLSLYVAFGIECHRPGGFLVKNKVMKVFVSVSMKGRKIELPDPYPTVAAANRFITANMKRLGVPRSVFSIRVEDSLDDIVRDGLNLCKKLGIDTSFLA